MKMTPVKTFDPEDPAAQILDAPSHVIRYAILVVAIIVILVAMGLLFKTCTPVTATSVKEKLLRNTRKKTE
jgi:hypothetical protein